jgi:hypothetical protein
MTRENHRANKSSRSHKKCRQNGNARRAGEGIREDGNKRVLQPRDRAGWGRGYEDNQR